MRIQNLSIENFLGARSVNVDLRTPVALFAGPNAAGKSSIRDAVALALTGDLGRITLKKDAAQLVTDGQAGGFAELTDADGDVHCVTITSAGKMTGGPKEPDPTLAYVLDAQRFAHLELKERRAFLFDLMGVKLAPAEIRTRLLNRLFPKGCTGEDSLRIDRVAPLLRAGFDAASKEAKDKATAAKGAWRALTGETYGAVKAATWAAVVPPFKAADLAAAQKQLATVDADLGAVQQQIGELQAAKKQHDEQLLKKSGLEATAERLTAIRDKLLRDEAELATWTKTLAQLQQRAGKGPRVGLVHDIANALNRVVYLLRGAQASDEELAEVEAALDAYEREHGKFGAAGDAEAAAKLPEASKSCALYATAVANDKRDLAAAERAVEDLKAITAATWTAAPLTAAQEHLAKLQADRKTQAAAVDALHAAKTAADGAATKTKDAAKHHADVAAWDAIGEALGPDGIPADLLREALGPINTRLEQSAVDSEWLRVAIDADMHITGGGRAYRLLSESERWRVDAMLAEAVASISGARLLVLDRMDVLEPGKAREDLFAWLDILAENGEIDTALVFGTLKSAPPAGSLPATVTAHWISAGVVAQLEALKEAA
jgi:hypothetical protein